MRTKALLGAALILAAGVATSMAQNVYSLNVVGYVSTTLKNGFNLINNPLDLDGTGFNNTVSGTFSSNLPTGTIVYTFKPDGSGFDQFQYISQKGQPVAWTAAGKLNPGMGAWVKIPSNNPTFTFVGNVLQGSLNNTNVRSVAGFSFVGSMAPLTGAIQQVLGYVPNSNDVVYRFKADQSGYDQFQYISQKGQPLAWAPSEPGIDVAQGFWINAAKSGTTWVKNFTVQ